MNKRICTVLALALMLVAALPLRASIKQVVNLSTSGSSVIIIPGSDTKVIVIQNNGSNSVRLSLDGGTATIVGGKAGTNPTPTTGLLLASGQQITIATVPYTGTTPDPSLHKPIVAIMVTSTTTLDIITDGVADQFPTT